MLREKIGKENRQARTQLWMLIWAHRLEKNKTQITFYTIFAHAQNSIALVLLRITILSCLIYRASPLQALPLLTPIGLLSSKPNLTHRRPVYGTFSTQTYSIPKSTQPMPVVSIFQSSDRFVPDTNELSIVSWNQVRRRLQWFDFQRIARQPPPI